MIIRLYAGFLVVRKVIHSIMENIFGKTKKACGVLMQDLGEASFRGKQLFEWLYIKKADALDECTNLSKKCREVLRANYFIGHGKVEQIQTDPVDHTKKYLIRLLDDNCIESVLMSYHHGHSLCISSQVGCRMGCAFCASAKGGKIRDLTSGEILDQVYLVEKEAGVRVSNIVIMGIGEPLDNYANILDFLEVVNEGWGVGQRKITLSTCGIVPQIEALAELNLQINLAISLHSPFQEQREQLMPIAKKYNMEELLKVCNNYFEKTKRRITFEYALIKDFNDRRQDAAELAKILGKMPYHVNLIGLNPVTESPYKGSENVNFFSNELKKHGINCTIRRKIGDNIDAACGQLRQKADGVKR